MTQRKYSKYSKMGKRIRRTRNRKNTRRTRDKHSRKRDPKKTQKRNKKGGTLLHAGLKDIEETTESVVKGHGKVETVIEDTGMPTTIGHTLNLLENKTVNILNKLYEGSPEDPKYDEYRDWKNREDDDEDDDEDEDEEYREFEIPPQVLIIHGHGGSRGDFTLIPEGMKLYLLNGAATALSYLANPYMDESPNYEAHNSDYIREYTGLVQNYDISFDMIYKNEDGKPLISARVPGIPAAIVVGLSGIMRYQLPLVGKDKKMTEYFIAINIAQRTRPHNSMDPRIWKKCRSAGDCTDYIKHMTGDNLTTIIPEEKMKELISEKKTIPLSELLQLIQKAREKDPNIPAKIFGVFCRSGNLPKLDVEDLLKCNSSGLPELPEAFFGQRILYESVSSELQRQSSLASTSITQAFHKILRDIRGKKEEGLLDLPDINAHLDKIFAKLDSDNPVLSKEDVCLIFQLKHLLLQSQ